MRKLWQFWRLTVLLSLTCSPSFAATEYVLVNNNSSVSNSAALYKLDAKTGKLTKTRVLETGGQAFQSPPNLAQSQQVVSRWAGCIFVLDNGSSDIAAFSKSTGYKRVGKYFDANLITGFYGGSLALTPSGEFLYATYEETGNLGVWAVNSDCSLTLVATYSDPSESGEMKVAPDGKYLILSGAGDAALLYSINQANGTLANLGSVGFNSGVCARETGGCVTHAVDITKDSKIAVFASDASNITRQYGIPVAMTARITPNGFADPRVWVLTHAKGWYVNFFPFLGAAGYGGSGDIYFGLWGAGITPGVLTATFTEHPMNFKFKNGTLIKNTPQDQDGNIAVTGNVMVIAEYPDQIGVFRIQKDGSVKLLSTTNVGVQGGGMFSLSIFPNTR